MNVNAVWFRNDLRLYDNKALYAACQDRYSRIIAIFIATPKQWKIHNLSNRQATLILNNIKQLSIELKIHGIEFYYYQCSDFTKQIIVLSKFCEKNKVVKLFYNYQYEFNERKRDIQLESILLGKTICIGFHDNVLLPPGSILSKKNSFLKIYTLFNKQFLVNLKNKNIISLPKPDKRKNIINSIFCNIFPFDYTTIPIDNKYLVTEKIALKCLDNFIEKKILNYNIYRDYPYMNATSEISAWLATGLLSPRQCYNSILTYNKNNNININYYIIWLNGLIWRDYYRHLIFLFPKLSQNKPFYEWSNNINWINEDNIFQSWCLGNTGYPIVDAAMRQLLQTGWINNRLRMIAASFLVKHLMIDWRLGESYFMSQLIDGDFASNNGNWQWIASTGCSSSPFFKIFNPVTQGKRFDPKGEFIYKWIPSLRKLNVNYMLDIPYNRNLLLQYDIKLDYTNPIINHEYARKRALHAYKNAYAIFKKNSNNIH